MEHQDATWADGHADSVERSRLSLRSAAARRTADLFDELHAGLLRYLSSLVRNPAEAEDLLQEVFLRLFRELHSGADIRDPRAWLFSVGHRLAVDSFRQREYEAAADEISDLRPDPEAAALDSERDRWLANAIAALSPQQRQCLSLRAEGLRYREIASLLGVQISTVRTMIVRAVSRLAGGPR